MYVHTGKSVVRLSDCLDMTIVVDWNVKPQTKQNKITSISLYFFIRYELAIVDVDRGKFLLKGDELMKKEKNSLLFHYIFYQV